MRLAGGCSLDGVQQVFNGAKAGTGRDGVWMFPLGTAMMMTMVRMRLWGGGQNPEMH